MNSLRWQGMLFADRVVEAGRAKAPCIVGLDPAIERMPAWLRDATPASGPAELLYRYNALVLEEVHDLVPVVKPQSAYYETFGSAGVAALERTIALARELGLIVLLDAKRGDIGPTAEAYARAYLTPELASGAPHPAHSDAITLSPYLGRDSLEPLLDCCAAGDHGVFVCVRTSNPGARDMQDLVVDGRPLYRHVAGWLADSYASGDQPVGETGYGNVGAVVGATYPDDAKVLREQLPHSLFLVPGIGPQGGDPGRLRSFFDSNGDGAVVAASRAIMYPEGVGDDEASTRGAVRQAAERFVETVTGAVRG